MLSIGYVSRVEKEKIEAIVQAEQERRDNVTVDSG